jgi:hypothetical protein
LDFAQRTRWTGYEGMKQREKTNPEQSKIRLTEAVERLVQLYEATGKKEEAAKWRNELEVIKAELKKGGGEAPIAPVRRPTAAQRTDQKESEKYEFPPPASTIIPGQDGRKATMERRAVARGLG